MKFSTGVFFAVLSSAISSASAKCGQWYTNACSGDRRYDDAVSAKLKQNGKVWKSFQGFWHGKMSISDRLGAPATAVFVSDTTPWGVPYTRDSIDVFVNNTVQGTRVYQHIWYVYPPAPPQFCGLPITDDGTNKKNYIGDEKVCGSHGYLAYSSNFGVATYEKDGVADIQHSAGSLTGSTGGQFIPLDESTMYVSVDTPVGTSSSSYYISDERTMVMTSDNYIISDLPPYNQFPLESYSRGTLKKTSVEVFEKAKADATDSSMIPREFVYNDHIHCGNCIMGDDCYDEAKVSSVDPLETEGPYVEGSTVNAGVVAGFVILGCVVIIGIMVFLHFRHLKVQSDRYKKQFARRVAETINIEGTHEQLSAEALAEEFKRIDADQNGTISKEELREFIQSGKAGKMSDEDFNAMWAAIDHDHSGNVDFSEFCAFLSDCNKAYDEEVRHN